MKRYRNPNVPTPTPSPDDKKKKGDGRVYAGGPNFRELNPRLKPKPEPTPKPNVATNQGGGKKKKRVIVGGGKKIGPAKNKDLYPGDQYAPKPTKPGKSRRRFLEQLNEMNKKSR